MAIKKKDTKPKRRKPPSGGFKPKPLPKKPGKKPSRPKPKPRREKPSKGNQLFLIGKQLKNPDLKPSDRAQLLDLKKRLTKPLNPKK